MTPEGSYAIYSTLAPNLPDLWFWNQGRCQKAGTWLNPYWDCPGFETTANLDAHLLPGTQVVTFYSYFGIWPNVGLEDHGRWATQTINIPPLGTPPGGFDQGQLFRYYNASTGDHFYTTSWYELGPGINGWAFEEVAAHVGQQLGTVPFYRFNDGHSHFYSTDVNEGTNAGYSQEGTAGFVYTTQVPNSVPLYRYYNTGLNYHFYTTDFAELGNGKSGFALEGIAAYVPGALGSSSVPLATSFVPPAGSLSTAFYGTRATLMADVDGDGRADGVAINDNDTFVALAAKTGNAFLSPTQWLSTAFHGTRATLMADVDGDRRADGVAINDNDTWVVRAH